MANLANVSNEAESTEQGQYPLFLSLSVFLPLFLSLSELYRTPS